MKNNSKSLYLTTIIILPFIPCRFWYNNFGRKRYISLYEVKKIQVDIISGSGESVGYIAAKEMVQKYADDQHIKNDMLPSSNGGKWVSASCVKLYPNEFSQDDKISIKKKVARETVLRVPSDNSRRYTTNYIMTIAASNFIEGKIPQDHPANTKLGTYGSQKLVGIMQDAYGKDVDFFRIRRSLLASTDDTTLFISPGKIVTHCKDNEMLVSSVHDNKTLMYYSKSCDDDDDENVKGMFVKLTFNLTGEVQVFNPCVTV